jgi:predicted negative regulator of RcsB-dependent stress response
VKRQTRKDLKTDKFALEVKEGVDFLNLHRTEVIRYGSIALAVLLIGGGIYLYNRYAAGVREQALADAMRIDNATVGNAPVQAGVLHYTTAAEKDAARNKALHDLASKYHGTQEGSIADFYLASDAAENGNLADAEKRFKDLVDNAPTAFASLARLSLAKVYDAEGKYDEAVKTLREAVAKPTMSVSKEDAEIQLAVEIGKKNPDEARKMLEPLRTERTAVSRAAVQALGDLGNPPPPPGQN